MAEIDISSLKSNSNLSKSNKSINDLKTEKIIKGTAIKAKKKGFGKYAGVFLSETMKNLKDYIIDDVLIPTIKKSIFDIITNGADIAIYGNNRNGAKRYSSISDRVSYRDYSSPVRVYDSKPIQQQSRLYSYDDIIVHSRQEAEDVLTRLGEIIEAYGVARVADLYDLVGITGSYTDNNYGWKSLIGSDVVRTREGYMIKLSRAVPIV